MFVLGNDAGFPTLDATRLDGITDDQILRQRRFLYGRYFASLSLETNTHPHTLWVLRVAKHDVKTSWTVTKQRGLILHSAHATGTRAPYSLHHFVCPVNNLSTSIVNWTSSLKQSILPFIDHVVLRP